MRNVAIIHFKTQRDIKETILSKIPNQKVHIFVPESEMEKEKSQNYGENTEILTIPDEFNRSQAKNHVLQHFKMGDFKGFLHVLEDSTRILKDPNVFLDKIEEMMGKLELHSWLNTSCDGCNYVFNKYNPRARVHLDRLEFLKYYDKTIFLCSNANTQWTIFDLDNGTEEEMSFDGRFDFAMYYIIEFLCRRRNSKTPGSLNYMNMYPTIEEEIGIFEKNRELDEKESKYDLEKEGKMFNEMKIDNHPDMNIEPILNDFIGILRHKSV